ncbi:hypothetical protein ALC57_14012, partial [Trachymyrmex cornetzi]
TLDKTRMTTTTTMTTTMTRAPSAENRRLRAIVADVVAAFCGRINVDCISEHQLLSPTLKLS